MPDDGFNSICVSVPGFAQLLSADRAAKERKSRKDS